MTTEERLQRLEKDLHAAKRNSRLLLGGVAAAAALLFLLGAGSGDVEAEIRAHRFVLVDSDGRTRAKLHLLDGYMPELALYDHNGVDRMGIGFSSDSTPSVYIVDPSRSDGVRIGHDRTGQPSLWIHGRTGAGILEAWDKRGFGIAKADKENGEYTWTGLATFTEQSASSQGQSSKRSKRSNAAYAAAKADYEQTLAAWEDALGRCDNMGIGADEINKLAANSKWADLLGTLGTINKQEAARKALVAKERLERAKARLEALDWKE